VIAILTATYGEVFEKITVNGESVPLSEVPFTYRAPLTPSTDYIVKVAPDRLGRESPSTLKFRTGVGPAPPPPPPAAPAVSQVRLTSTRDLSPDCLAVWHALGCFDTGPLHLVFEAPGEPLYWVVGPLRAPRGHVGRPPGHRCFMRAQLPRVGRGLRRPERDERGALPDSAGRGEACRGS
jgi:hypothetical protein